MGKFRSKTGCLTCRTRRVKCDEGRPVCGQCGKKSRTCRYEAAGVNIKQYKPHEKAGGSAAAPPSEDDGDDYEDREATVEGEDDMQRRPQTHLSQHDAVRDGESSVSSMSHGPSTTTPSSSSRLSLVASPSRGGDLSLSDGLPGATLLFEAPRRPPAQAVTLSRHEAELVHHFVEYLSRWLDCTDATRQFSLVIPVLVKHDAILLHAVLAFAAKHRKDVATAQQAYGHCLSLLIERLQSENVVHDDALLCAIVILRFVEQLDVSLTGLDSQQHLAGCSAMLRASQGPTVDPSAPTLHQTAFWVYVRQCLYTATVNQQPPDVDITLQLVSTAQPFPVNHPSVTLAQETSWANSMTWLCTRVVHYCFDGVSGSASTNPTARQALWNELSDGVQRWSDEKPESFNPIWVSPVGDSSIFPETLFTTDWHGIAFGFYHFSRILLLTYKPTPRFAARNVGARFKTDDHDILCHARAICGACSSSPANVSNLITFCHSIFIWGPLMSDPMERNAVLEVLANLEDLHSWPTTWITNALKGEWDL